MSVFIFVLSVCGGYYTALSNDFIHDVLVLFTFAEVEAEVVWFKSFSLRPRSKFKLVKFKTLVSAKDSDPMWQQIYININTTRISFGFCANSQISMLPGLQRFLIGVFSGNYC